MEIEPENFSEPDIKPDRSVLYFGLAMGSIILVMALLSIFMEDIRRAFNPPPSPITLSQSESASLAESAAKPDDETVKASLIQFIEAFYVDQRKGYFDPPSYFVPITETYYNYHHLTYARLKQVHQSRLADLKELKLNWLVHTLSFEHRNDTLVATYWTKQSFFKPSKNAQESADILLEMKINKEGKIASLRELEIRNLVSVVYAPPADTAPESHSKVLPPPSQPSENKAKPAAEPSVYNSGVLDFPPEFPGGNKKLIRFLNRNLNYPNTARQQGVQGKVFVSFVVETDGDLSNLKVIRGIGSGCDEEALRVVSKSAPWKPGMLDGKTVRSTYVLPIIFQLAE